MERINAGATTGKISGEARRFLAVREDVFFPEVSSGITCDRTGKNYLKSSSIHDVNIRERRGQS